MNLTNNDKKLFEILDGEIDKSLSFGCNIDIAKNYYKLTKEAINRLNKIYGHSLNNEQVEKLAIEADEEDRYSYMLIPLSKEDVELARGCNMEAIATTTPELFNQISIVNPDKASYILKNISSKDKQFFNFYIESKDQGKVFSDIRFEGDYIRDKILGHYPSHADVLRYYYKTSRRIEVEMGELCSTPKEGEINPHREILYLTWLNEKEDCYAKYYFDLTKTIQNYTEEQKEELIKFLESIN